MPIIDTHRLETIDHHVNDATLVLLDIDLTLFNWPDLIKHTLLNKSFLNHLIKNWQRQGLDRAAMHQAMDKVIHVFDVLPPTLVEESAPGRVKAWQARGAETLAVTARPSAPGVWIGLVERLHRQLDTLGFELHAQAPWQATFDLNEAGTQRSERGVLFANFEDKGAAILSAMAHVGYQRNNAPDFNLLFVDDRRHNCDAVADAFQHLGERCVCVHYLAEATAVDDDTLDHEAHARALGAYLPGGVLP